MELEHWPKVKAIFEAALDVDSSGRELFVRNSSGTDHQIFQEVMSLLERDSSGMLFKNPVAQQHRAGALLEERYRLGEEIGRGGFGVVYSARDEKLDGRQVVVKTPHRQNPNETWPAERFEREIKALSRIDHPGVVGALDRGIMPDGRPFFVMQFVGGRPLTEVIASGPVSLKRTADISAQIGRALAAAHKGGVWHRDLKPGNVMLQSMPDGSELVRLIDFGIATVKDAGNFANREQTQNIVGSLAYMAPEQFQGTVSPATDLYAFGVILFEMLAGSKPFEAREVRELLTQQRAGALSKLQRMRPDLPPVSARLICDALSCDPDKRPQDPSDFGVQVARSLATVPGETVSRRKVLLGATGCAAAVVAATTWWYFRPRPFMPTITYSVLVQRQGGVPNFMLPGQILGNSDSFLLLVRSASQGHLYVLSEEQGNASINILFPLDHGSSLMNAGEQKRIPPDNSFGFDNGPGTPTLWLIWSEDEFKQFEGLRRWNNSRDKGEIKDIADRSTIRQALSELPQPKLGPVTEGGEQAVPMSASRFAWKIKMAGEPR